VAISSLWPRELDLKEEIDAVNMKYFKWLLSVMVIKKHQPMHILEKTREIFFTHDGKKWSGCIESVYSQKRGR